MHACPPTPGLLSPLPGLSQAVFWTNAASQSQACGMVHSHPRGEASNCFQAGLDFAQVRKPSPGEAYILPCRSLDRLSYLGPGHDRSGQRRLVLWEERRRRCPQLKCPGLPCYLLSIPSSPGHTALSPSKGSRPVLLVELLTLAQSWNDLLPLLQQPEDSTVFPLPGGQWT